MEQVNMKKKEFTSDELIRKGFTWDNDNGDMFLEYKCRPDNNGKFLITNDDSIHEENRWFVDYGVYDPSTNLDEGLIDDFIKVMDGDFKMEVWFKSLTSRAV